MPISTSSATARVRTRLQQFLRVNQAEDAARELDDRVRLLEGSELEWQALIEAHHQTRLLADHATRLGEQASLLGSQYGLTLHDHESRVAALDRLASVRTLTWWLAQATVPEADTISVVLATRNRADLLERAIESVQHQHYGNWQLVVVDDGSTDDTASRCAAIDDPRIELVSIDHRGPGGARNAGLERAAGSIVAYLDDDNVMHPLWLKSVAWAFGQRPEVDVLYGARLVDGTSRGDAGSVADGMPSLHFEPFDRDVLERGNLADLGALAHRAGLAEATFDERLARYGDWDLLLRLTAEADALALPAIACLYTVDQAERLTTTVDGERDRDLVLAKLRQR